MAWNIAGVGRRTRAAAVEAARQAGMRLDDWLDEAIADYAGLDQQTRSEHDDVDDARLDAAAGRLERMARGTAPHQARSLSSFDPVLDSFETRLSRAEAQAARAFESVAHIIERDTAARDSDRRALIDAVRRLESIRASLTGADRSVDRSPQPSALDPRPPFDLKAAVSQIAMRRHEIETRDAGRAVATPGPQKPSDADTTPASQAKRSSAQLEAAERGVGAPPAARDAGGASSLPQLLSGDIRALGRKLDDMRRERADQREVGVDLGSMRAEIDAMRQSLAELAPRNAVVAIEGAIRDLAQRVEMLRQSGHGESMLAPLEAMAAEFRAALKAHDPQAAAAALEREIRAIGGKVDSLAAAAIEPETFERIRRQTEEVRNLLASAALRAPPLERLERQIGELADRVERLAANPAPHFEFRRSGRASRGSLPTDRTLHNPGGAYLDRAAPRANRDAAGSRNFSPDRSSGQSGPV